MDLSSIPPPPATILAPVCLFPAELTTNNNHVPPPAATSTAKPTPVPPPSSSVSTPAQAQALAQVQAQAQGSSPNHPPYSETIYAVMEALKEKNGSSKRAIGKYIEQAYRALPPTYSAVLTTPITNQKERMQRGRAVVDSN